MKLKIKGKMVECRKLRVGETRREGDLFKMGDKWETTGDVGGMITDLSYDYYRPLKPLPKKQARKKGEIKPVNAWCAEQDGVIRRDIIYPSKRAAINHQQRMQWIGRIIPVTITLKERK